MPQNPASQSPKSTVPVELPLAERIEAAVTKYGEPNVVAGALSLIAGNNEGADFLLYVGGEHAQGILDGAPALYWPELWGVRALMYVWDDTAAPSVIRTLGNTAWRVREMGARTVAARKLPAAAELATLTNDDTPRVRIAAARALGTVGTIENMSAIKSLLKDPLIDVRRAAQQALDTLRARFPKK